MTALDADLARRAVACAGWRWMPGMLTLPFHENGPDSPVCHPPWRVTREGVSGPYANAENNDAPPDLTDPATLGCLLALVREWHGNYSMSTAHVGVILDADGGLVPEWAVRDSYMAPAQFYGPREAGALVAALEAPKLVKA